MRKEMGEKEEKEKRKKNNNKGNLIFKKKLPRWGNTQESHHPIRGEEEGEG